jgi:RimJ/RimL family protein N-acetyltransferase
MYSVENLESLFKSMEDHLGLYALLNGCISGEVFVDQPEHPEAALACIYQRRFFLAGSPGNAAFNDRMRAFFKEVVFPIARQRQAEAFLVYYDSAGWQSALSDILPEIELIRAEWQYYTCRTHLKNWREMLPIGFELRDVDQTLLANPYLKYIDQLKDEMCSERASIEDFLENSFGVCAIFDNEIAGMCLSEYNCLDRCEVGIMTMNAYQRKGLATTMASALIERALEIGITQVGWHCYARNLPSVNTALKAGFVKQSDYPVYIVRIPPG